MSFIPGHFYKYRKAVRNALRSSFRIGDTYQFHKELDLFPRTEKTYIWKNALGEDFDLQFSYAALDAERLEEKFEEVPKPSWWDQPGRIAQD